jgi:IMP dehydrogenase/GMP reductase
MKPSFTYSDVGLVPYQESTIKSRNDVDVSTQLGNQKIKIPLIVSPMHTISGVEVYEV